MSSIRPLQMILKPYEKLKNRLQNLKRKIQKQTLQKQKLRQMIPSPFNNFSGKDFDGNSVDESLFSKNAVTVVNFWFTGSANLSSSSNYPSLMN